MQMTFDDVDHAFFIFSFLAARFITPNLGKMQIS